MNTATNGHGPQSPLRYGDLTPETRRVHLFDRDLTAYVNTPGRRRRSAVIEFDAALDRYRDALAAAVQGGKSRDDIAWSAFLDVALGVVLPDLTPEEIDSIDEAPALEILYDLHWLKRTDEQAETADAGKGTGRATSGPSSRSKGASARSPVSAATNSDG